MSELRMILTSTCNYRCGFCHHEGFDNLPRFKVEPFNKDDWLYLYKVVRNVNKWNTVTLSGGEPLLYSQFDDLIAALSFEKCNIVVTTNGFNIDKHLTVFKQINRVNISLHTLNKEKYDHISGVKGAFQKVYTNIIDLRKSNPGLNICINVTLNCNSKNEVKSEILSILHFASKIDASVKFTEIFPLTQDLSISGNSGDYIARCLYNHKFNLTCDKGRKLEFNNGTTTCSINRIFCAYASKEKDPIHVCQTTNDYFVSSMGIIKFCRFDQSQTSIYSAVKERRDELILKALCFRKKYAIDNCIRHLSELEELKS